MINNTVNLTVRHNKRIGVQLIKMAVVDSGRGTGSHKMHASIINGGCARSIFECKARQSKRLRGLELRYKNSRPTSPRGDGCVRGCVRFRSYTCLAAQRRCAGKNWLGLLRRPLLLPRRRLPMALAREVVENDSFVCYHGAT